VCKKKQSECLCVEITGPGIIENLISGVYGSEQLSQIMQSAIQDWLTFS